MAGTGPGMPLAVLALLMAPVLLMASGAIVQGKDEKETWGMTEPDYKEGDFWEYEVDRDGEGYNENHTVDKVTNRYKIVIEAEYLSNGDMVTIEGETWLEMSDLSVIERYVMTRTTDPGSNTRTTEVTYQYNPPLKNYEWPLVDGGDWSDDTDLTITTKEDGNESSDTNSLAYTVKVHEIEDVTVPAGTFHAIKMEMDSDGHRIDIWYSAEVGNVVKELEASGGSRELKGYSCDSPGDIKKIDDNGGGGFDPLAMGAVCMMMPLVIGIILGLFCGAIIGLYGGYSSKMPRIKRKKGRPKAKRSRTGTAGPEFCPKHGCRTEEQDGVLWCHECEGSPMMRFNYCPHHGVKIRELDGVPLCPDCGGEVKW